MMKAKNQLTILRLYTNRKFIQKMWLTEKLGKISAYLRNEKAMTLD